MQERDYLGSREHPQYCTCVECQTKRTAPAPIKLSSSEKKRRRKARQKAAKSDPSAIDSSRGDGDGAQANQPGTDSGVDSLLEQANEIVKQTPNSGSKKKKKRRKRK